MLLGRFSPDDFRTDQHLWDTFGHIATETAARWVLRYLQQRGKGWEPFTVGEIRTWFDETVITLRLVREPFMFHRLIHKPRGVHTRAPIEVSPAGDGTDFGLTTEGVCVVTDQFVLTIIKIGEHLKHPPMVLTGS